MKSALSLLFILLLIRGAYAQNLFEKAVNGEFDVSITQDEHQLVSPLTFAGINVEINGYLRGDIWIGEDIDDNSADVKTGYAEGSLKLKAGKKDVLNAFIETRLWTGYKDDDEQAELDLREAYINTHISLLDFRFGHQIISWGCADGINPADNLTPVDMRVQSPLEDDIKMANFGLRTWINAHPFRLEVVTLPFFRESHYPEFNVPVNVFLTESDFPETDLSDGIWALKLQYQTPAIDASLSYKTGYDTFPGIELKSFELDSAGIPIVSIGYKAYRHRVLGFNVETTISRFELHGEAVYRMTDDYKQLEYVPSPDVWCVIGVEHEFFNQISVIAQYIGHYILDVERGCLDHIPAPACGEIVQVNRMIFSQLEEVQHGMSLHLIWKLFQDTLVSDTFYMVNFSTRERMIRQKIEYDLTDTVTIIVGGEYFSGPEGTFFDAIHYSKNAVFAEIRFSF